MKTLHLFLGFGLLGAAAQQVEAQNNMLLHFKDATHKVYAMEEVKSLTFPAGKLSVNKVQAASELLAFASLRSAQFQLQESPLSLEDDLGTSTPALLAISPNPLVGENLRIQLEALSGGTFAIEFMDTRGQLTKQLHVSGQAGKNEWQVNMDGMPSGVYLCRVRTEGQSAIKKFIKH